MLVKHDMLLFAAHMAEKRRYTVTVPEHVAETIEARAKSLDATPTEYAADILRWWYGQNCPAVSPDEARMRLRKAPIEELMKRILPIPESLDVLSLAPEKQYFVTDDNAVSKIMAQLELSHLFAPAANYDIVRFAIFFDNHPTHWLQFDLYKGSNRKEGDGLAFAAYPKASVSRAQMLKTMAKTAKEMDVTEELRFSQIPMFEKKASSVQMVGGVGAA